MAADLILQNWGNSIVRSSTSSSRSPFSKRPQFYVHDDDGANDHYDHDDDDANDNHRRRLATVDTGDNSFSEEQLAQKQ